MGKNIFSLLHFSDKIKTYKVCKRSHKEITLHETELQACACVRVCGHKFKVVIQWYYDDDTIPTQLR